MVLPSSDESEESGESEGVAGASVDGVAADSLTTPDSLTWSALSSDMEELTLDATLLTALETPPELAFWSLQRVNTRSAVGEQAWVLTSSLGWL